MKTQLQKMKMLTVLLAVAGMLFSGSAFAAIAISGSLAVTATGANTANTIANHPLGVLVTALRYSGTPAVVVGSYPTYTNAAGNYAFSGLPISGSDYYVVRASAALYYGAPYNNGGDTHITANTAGANLTLVFNKFAFNGGSGSFPLWEQFLSSATIDGANLVDGDQIGVWDASSSQYVGLMIITGGLVTSNVFDQTNNLVSYSKLSGAGNPAGYTSGAASAYRLWLLGAGAYSGAVSAVRSNIDGVCWMTNFFPTTGLYAHSVTSLQFYTGTLRKLSGKVKDAFTTLNINGATVTCGGYSFISAGTGDYDLGTNFVDGTSYSVTASLTGYTSGTESGTISGNTTKNILLTPKGGISGHVVLAGSGDGVAGVTVTATYDAYTSSAVTDVYGGYAISGISNYTYTLSATKPHYTTGNSSAVVANGTITTGVDLTISYSESLWADVTGDPDKTWTIYLAQAKLNGVDLAPNDEIAVFDNSFGKIAGRYTLTGVLTSGAALSHDMIAFEDIGLSGQGYTVNSPYTFKCYQRSTSTIYYLESFSIDPARSSWTDADHAPSASNPTKYTTVALNFTNVDPSNYSQSIYLKQGINWVSSFIAHNTADMVSIFPAGSSWWAGAAHTGGDNIDSYLQSIKNTAGNFVWVNNVSGPVIGNAIGNWVNTEGYVFTMNYSKTLTITGTRIDPATVIDLNNIAKPAAFFLVGNLLTNPINAATAFSELLSGGALNPTYTQYIKNSAGRMFWNIGGVLVNNIGNIVPGEAYQFLVTAGAHPNFRLHSTKSGALVTEDYNATHFQVSGNAADNVFTVYVKTSDFAAGDEIAAFDGTTLVGATKLISTSGTFDNPIPAFMTLSTGEGYKVGNPITLKAWSASENKEYDVTYTLDNTDGAYYNTVYPNGDGKFCIATVTKGALGINDASPVVANVYPNPAHEYLKVVADRTIDNIYLMNIVGQKVAGKSVNGTSTQLNLSGITSGVYFLRIECNGQVSTQKVLIQ